MKKYENKAFSLMKINENENVFNIKFTEKACKSLFIML